MIRRSGPQHPLAARLLAVWALALLLPAAYPPSAAAGETADPQAGAPLSPPHQRWLDAVAPLISEVERQAFVALSQDYRRGAFIDQFWRVRDPFPETARNELRERWETHLAEAEQRFGDGIDDRVRMYAALGEPSAIIPGSCPGFLEQLEIWRYENGQLGPDRLHLVFVRRPGRDGREHRLWYPREGLSRLLVSPAPGAGTADLLRAVVDNCFRGDDVANGLATAIDWNLVREDGAIFPTPGTEWVTTFAAYSTDLPGGAGTFAADFDLSYPGRHQSRTVLQGLIAVPEDEAEVNALGDSRSFDFAIDGEVLRKGELFERFRYRFHLPVDEVDDGAIPLLFHRYLRPGTYRLVVRVEDLASSRYFRVETDLEVPAVRRAMPAVASEETVDDGSATASLAGDPSGEDPAAEANASLQAGDHSIRLLPPAPGLAFGITRVEAVVSGGEAARVSFAVDGKPVLAKSRAPYRVEIDLGEAPQTHIIAAAALDDDGAVLARDELVVNAGPHRFAVRLVEPQRGRTYSKSLRCQAEIEVPEGETLDRVELYLNETLLVTLYQPPFAVPLLLPDDLGIAYVRAVAYLADDSSVEDLVFVNAPEHLDEIDVRMVELYTSALDRRGRPVDDLAAADFSVLEDGQEQAIRRFDRVRDLPVWAGLLLDRSSSMGEEIDEVVKGALVFFDQVLTDKDRATVITFNHQPELAVRFTNDREVLAGGVAGIVAEGGTQLYDSLVHATYYFSGINGKRALILISDGDDQGGGHFDFDDALAYAQRTGVAVYAIGLGLPGRDGRTRMQLQRLGTETGGRSFFISSAGELARVYGMIEEELRSQYLIAYQSTHSEHGGSFRKVEVEVARPGVQAKTVRGYFP